MKGVEKVEAWRAPDGNIYEKEKDAKKAAVNVAAFKVFLEWAETYDESFKNLEICNAGTAAASIVFRLHAAGVLSDLMKVADIDIAVITRTVDDGFGTWP